MIEYNKPYKYRHLCEALGIETLRGGYQKNQLADLNLQYEIIKDDKTKQYTVIREYTDVEQADNRWTKMCTDNRYDYFKVPSNKRKCMGIYIIQYENQVYIGQTINLLKRFNSHWKGSDSFSHQGHELMKLGATFSVLEYVQDKEKLNSLEEKYIKLYLKDYNYICLNKQKGNNPINRKTKCDRCSKNYNPNYFNIRIDFKNKERVLEALRKMEIDIYDEK